MEIRLLRRDEIDDAQWNDRVAASGNGLPYALTDYLDIVTNRNWCALVGDDYYAIFPLPIERKLGLTMYLQPPFTQQLGLIAKTYSPEVLLSFLASIPNDFNMLHLKGNESNKIITHTDYDIKTRSNLLLPLNRDYDTINAGYSKSLRKRIRQNKEYYEIIESKDVELVVSFYQKEMKTRVGLNSEQYNVARKLIAHLIESGLGIIYVAQSNGDIHGALFVVKYQNRIINLFGTSNSDGKKNFAMHLILDHIIEQNSTTNKILDFEGSDLPGVKKFYESFGSDQVAYPEFYKEQLPLWYKVVRKLKSLKS